MNRIGNIDSVIQSLLQERRQQMEIPDGLYGKQRLMRALCNVRPPMPIGTEILQLQDEELQCQLADKGLVTLDEIPVGSIRLWQGDITRLKVDAIVNAANAQMLGCFQPLHGCIDNAIHSAAGIQLRLECERIMQGRELETGGAILTGGYNLPAKHVIHTVGPIVPSGRPTAAQQEQLADCYRNCLRVASEAGLTSIAFCCISTGVFNFPQRLAAEIAINTVRECLSVDSSVAALPQNDSACHPERSEGSIQTVIFNVFKDDDYVLYHELLG